jgi:hypothetical protein
MHGEGTLELFAELFVAFAGFTALAGVILRSETETSSLRQEIRLLLEYSLLYVILSALPLVLFHAGFSELGAWRLACATSATQTAVYYAVRFGSLRTWSTGAGTAAFFWLTCAVDWLVSVLLLSAALQFGQVPPHSLYLIHLLWGLIGTALSFARLAKPIWQTSVGSDAAFYVGLAVNPRGRLVWILHRWSSVVGLIPDPSAS